MENTELTKKSDVGPKSSYDLMVKTNKLIHDNCDYNSLTIDIKRDINSIFDNYLSIGNSLKEIKDRKLYLVNEYKNVYEYSNKEFELSSTTTKNIISISKRFCNEHGELEDEYEDFTFSNLVELLSVKEEDIKKFIPGMTVKAVRSKKLELDVNAKIDEMFNEKGYLTEVINLISNYDWKTKLGLKEFELLHDVQKESFDSSPGEYYWSRDDYSIKIIFTIKSNKNDVSFSFNLNLQSLITSLRGETNINFWLNVSERKINKNDLIYISKQIEEVFTVSKDDYNSNNSGDTNETVSPGYHKLSYLLVTWESSSYFSLLKNYISKLDNDYYYEEKNNVSIIIYASGKRHKTKNLPLYEIKYMDDPRETFIVNHLKDGIEIKLFDDFDEYFNNKISIIKDNII